MAETKRRERRLASGMRKWYVNYERVNVARRLYSLGYDVPSIAGQLLVSPSTVHRWRRADGEDGLNWCMLRRQVRRACPAALVAVLYRRMGEIAERGDVLTAQQADALLKLQLIAHREQDRIDRGEGA